MLAWATATFWFPLMVAIGVWRHIVDRVPLRYHPSYWALVFPLGMYGAATFRMRAAIELDGARRGCPRSPSPSRSRPGPPPSSACSSKVFGQSPVLAAPRQERRSRSRSPSGQCTFVAHPRHSKILINRALESNSQRPTPWRANAGKA